MALSSKKLYLGPCLKINGEEEAFMVFCKGMNAILNAAKSLCPNQTNVRDQSLLMVGGGAEDIKGGSPIIFLPRWGGQIKNQTARGGAMKNNQLKLTSILFRNK